MQSSQVVPQPAVLSFDLSHVCFTDNLVAVRHKHRIDLPAICDVEETLHKLTTDHSRLKVFALLSPIAQPSIPGLKWSTAVHIQTFSF